MMQSELVTRRTQFSSCDECRRSRVACDASSRGQAEGSEEPVSCTRCLKRQKPCTFKWVSENKASASRKLSTKRKRRRRQPSVSASETATSQQNAPGDVLTAAARGFGSSPGSEGLPSFSSESHSTRATATALLKLSFGGPPDPLSQSDSEWLSVIYQTGYETVFGSWMGRYGNPFVTDNAFADKHVSISYLCRQLDKWMADDFGAGNTSARDDAQERLIDESLRSTTAAFSSRWLPLATGASSNDPETSALMQNLWRYARRDMLRVINRPCYRSMLSLFLFALTPIPVGISEEEEVDGISGQACVHAALQHIQVLRARQRNLHFSGSKVSPYLKKHIIPTSPGSIDTFNFIHAESTAYWAALTFDTSASLTLNCRSLLSSGLFGYEEELCWRLIRSKAKMFDDVAQGWSTNSLDMTDERANQIVAVGSGWKLLAWKLTAVFKEALRDGHDESRVLKAYNAVVDAIKQFDLIFRPHLDACQRRMQFLGQQAKLRWYSLMLHYHLSILMLVDIIEATERFDLLRGVQDAAADAENTVMNTLVFGLHNTCTVTLDPSVVSPTSERDGRQRKKSSITVPLTSIDPYPHHIVAGVQLVRKAVERDYGEGKITNESYENLQSMLEQTLSLLPQSSKSVRAARTKLATPSESGVSEPWQDPYGSMQGQYTE
uniref:Zn(2)-C6 fungal-type domain-containing protein n=1 Tax=Bionectria ochroleuca TaxID=29856 RepID=A0A8H7NNM4_BIOOC